MECSSLILEWNKHFRFSIKTYIYLDYYLLTFSLPLLGLEATQTIIMHWNFDYKIRK